MIARSYVQSDQSDGKNGGSVKARTANALRKAFHPQMILRGLDNNVVFPDTLGQDSTVWSRHVNQGVADALSDKSPILALIADVQSFDQNTFHDRV